MYYRRITRESSSKNSFSSRKRYIGLLEKGRQTSYRNSLGSYGIGAL